MDLNKKQLKEIDDEFKKAWTNPFEYIGNKPVKESVTKGLARSMFATAFIKLIEVREEKERMERVSQKHCEEVKKYFDIARNLYKQIKKSDHKFLNFYANGYFDEFELENE